MILRKIEKLFFLFICRCEISRFVFHRRKIIQAAIENSTLNWLLNIFVAKIRTSAGKKITIRQLVHSQNFYISILLTNDKFIIEYGVPKLGGLGDVSS